MERIRVTATTLPVILYVLSGLTLLFAASQVVQIPLGSLPADSQRLSVAPYSHFAHVLGGVLFGIIGPLQFGRILAHKYGALHRIMGRVFVVAGAFLSLSSLMLLWQFPDTYSALASGGRLVFGIGLGISLWMGMAAIRARQFLRHRDWMIRSYALGMGATLVAIVFLPIYAMTGTPPEGLWSDVMFIGSWAGCVIFAEGVVRRLNQKAQAANA